MADRKIFYNQLNFFSRYFEVFAPDLAGFGENLHMPSPYSLQDYLDSVEEYMYKRGIKRPHVVGHSFGGRIVILGASKNKQLFDKIVLTGCAGLKPKPTIKKTAKKLAYKILKNFTPKDKLKKFYSKDYLSLSPVMQQSFIKIVNEHLDDKISLIENQTLLIFGKNDKETPLYMAKKLNGGIIDSKLIIFENAGHFCFLDCPNKFNLEVREFLLSK